MELDTTVLAVSIDDLSKARIIAEGLGLPYPILYDPDADVISDYGLYDLLGDGLATPATFIIDKDGVIRYRFVADRYYERPDADDIINELRALEG